MEGRKELLAYLKDTVGEEGCGVSCDDADIFHDQKGWNLMLCGFLEPWPLGETVEEAKASIKEYASQGFGMSS